MSKYGSRKSKAVVEEALRLSNGRITDAARRLGVSYNAVQKRIKKHSDLQAVQQEMRENLLDKAESKLDERVEEGDLGAICFTLKCQGKHRGWVEKQQQEISGGLEVKVVSFADNEDNEED